MSRLPLLLLAAVALAACSEGPARSGSVELGRLTYLAQCATCHNPDPAQAGAIGPPVKGASRALLETKVLRGAYPDGYRPKRPTAVMPPQPGLAAEIPALADYLR